MARDFEDHCWKDVIDADTIQIYQAYRRKIYVGDNPAVLAIDLYNKAYRGGDRPGVVNVHAQVAPAVDPGDDPIGSGPVGQVASDPHAIGRRPLHDDHRADPADVGGSAPHLGRDRMALAAPADRRRDDINLDVAHRTDRFP